MAGSQTELPPTPSELRKEAQRLLDVAIRTEAPGTRKQLLAASFELIQRAEVTAEPIAPTAEGQD
jgi:hypothetical protein